MRLAQIRSRSKAAVLRLWKVARRIGGRIRRFATRRRLVWAAVGVIGPYVAYLIVVNALLASGLMKKMVNGLAPSHVHFEWESAYSVWFMRVHVRDFVVQGTDDVVEWRVTADETTGSLGATDFFSRRVRVHDAVARGATMRLRFKLDPKDATPARVAALPPIEGFSDPPLKPGAVPPPPNDESYDLWTVELDDVDASNVREVWVDSVRLTDMGGHAHGGFYLKPAREVWVPPTDFNLTDAQVSMGKAILAKDVRGAFGLRLVSFDPRERKGRAALGALDVKAVVAGTLGDLSFADPILPKALALSGGEGPIQARIDVQSGVVQPGSRVDGRLGDWSAWAGANRVSGTSLVHAAIPKKTKPDIETWVESYGVGIHHRRVEIARGAAVLAFVRVDAVDLTRDVGPWVASLDAPQVKVRNLAVLDEYAGESLFASGSAGAKVHADIDAHGASGHADASFSNAATKLGGALVVVNGTAKVKLHHWDFDSGTADVSGSTAEVHDVAFGPHRGWWASFAVAPADLHLSGTPELSAFLTAKLRDGQLPLAIASAPGLLGSLIGKQAFTLSAHVHQSVALTDFEDVRVIGDTTDVRAHYRSDAGGKNGAALVTMPLVNLGVVVRKGDVSVVPFATRSWYGPNGRPGS